MRHRLHLPAKLPALLARRSLFGFLRCASRIVPQHARVEWLAEWEGELAHVVRVRRRGCLVGACAPIRFCLGAIPDALWFARNRPAWMGRPGYLKSPSRCLLFLAALAIVGWFASSIGGNLSGGSMHGVARAELYADDQAFSSFLIELVVALIVLPSISSVSMGEYPRVTLAGRRQIRWRLQLFLFAKIVCVLLLACFLGKTVAHLVETVAVVEQWPMLTWCIRKALTPIQPFATCLACLYGMRWALRDQRQRCPTCLHLLSSPARVGAPSRSFLAWNGTELICRDGHGLLHVPEMQMSWLASQRWQELDQSWEMLFPK